VNKKVLVAYFSHSGNTREIANQIRNKVGGDIFELQTIDSYPRNYNAVVEQAKREIESGYKPALKSKIENIEEYDMLFLGSPVWWYTVAPPIATFLSEYDLSGKTIAPFCTHGGGGLSRCASDIAKLSPQSTILNGLAVRGGDVKNAQNDVFKWLRKIGMTK
jgi:flavodoxin